MATLAARLRELRHGRSLNQATLGQLIGVKPPTISSWERGEAAPPGERVEAYARLFASERTVTLGRLLKDAEFGDAERTAYGELLAELTALRDDQPSPASDTDLWHFGDSAPILLIAGRLKDEVSEFASGRSWNYIGLTAFADLDALVQLYGHIREKNPGTRVSYKFPSRLEGEDISGAHLVFVGNLGLSQSDMGALFPPLPVRQVPEPETPDGEVFEVVATGERLRPRYNGTGPEAPVVEDIGLLTRFPSPLDDRRSVTICSGVHTRGVYGAVRTLTAHQARDRNTAWLRKRFPDLGRFGVVFRVPCTDHAIPPPQLANPHIRLLEFELP